MTTNRPVIMPVISLADDRWYIDVSREMPERLLMGPYLARDEAVRTREHMKRMWRQERRLEVQPEDVKPAEVTR